MESELPEWRRFYPKAADAEEAFEHLLDDTNDLRHNRPIRRFKAYDTSPPQERIDNRETVSSDLSNCEPIR
jgi:hypothetical protein